MYRLVRELSSETMTVKTDRYQELPTQCVVESDDGERMFLTATERFPEHLWTLAVEMSPAFIYCVENSSAIYVHDDGFVENRTEIEGQFVAPDWAWFEAALPAEIADLYDDHQHRYDPPEGAAERFVHLHTHSEYSALDGLSNMFEIMEAVQADGGRAVAVTDHGNCAAHPALQKAADQYGIAPIFGMEAYLQDDRTQHDTTTRFGYWHLTLWAMDDTGLSNLWAMSTEGFFDGFYDDKPRIDWSTLERYGEGVLASTGCLRGPVSHLLSRGDQMDQEPDVEGAEANLERLKRIFGDRLYVELHTNHLPFQVDVNKTLVKMAGAHGLPMVAVCDSHYATHDERDTHHVWINSQTGKDYGQESGMFGGGQDYHLHTEAEVRDALAYLGPEVVEASVTETARLARRCTARMTGSPKAPVYSRPHAHADPVQADIDKLIEVCEKNWEKRTRKSGVDQELYFKRFDEEIALLIEKGFCGYFLMVWDFVAWAKRNRILVGPGRGSGGGCLIAYLLGITEIDPVRHDLLFARFMTKGREELPDFDIDFPKSKKMALSNYMRDRWGSDHVAVVGTHTRLKNKGVVETLGRIMKAELPPEAFTDLKAFADLVDEAEADTAGMGKSWEDLWDQHPELEPYRARYPELFALADRLVGRLKTYGKHAAGLIVDPDHSLHGALPLRKADDGQMVTQFDFPELEALGYVKFDMLNLRTLDTIQQAIDLIFERTGYWVDIYEWEDEYTDPQVFEEIGLGNTLGHFQTETNSGVRMMRRLAPCSLAELADGVTLVRPGPMNSGLTDTFLRRRAGDAEVTVPDERLRPVLSKTFGCLIYQEDIMATTMVLAGYDDVEADKVRKILGKKKVEQAKAAGEQFIAKAEELGGDTQALIKLWGQMAEFAKYSFNRAHAFSYAILSYWTAWLKYHYPLEFLCATMSTIDSKRIPDFVEETRRLGFKVLPPDINISKRGFVCTVDSIRYGLEAINGVGAAAIGPIIEGQPFADFEDFWERKTSKCNIGHVTALAHIGAFDSLVSHRRWLENHLAERKVASEKPVLQCVFRNDLKLGAPNNLPCEFDWDNEPKQLGRTGKPLKNQKQPPAKCTKSCRNFTPKPAPTFEEIERYTEADIRNIEMEELKVYLSSTPFDMIPDEEKENLATALDVANGGNGSYMMAAIVRGGVRLKEKNGNRFGFVTLYTERGTIDAIVFAKYLDTYLDALNRGGMKLVSVTKNDRGQQLSHLIELD